MIKKVTLKKHSNHSYPFNIPIIKAFESLSLDNKITIFVGDNGSGKSTLLKAIAHHQKAINTASTKTIQRQIEVIKPLSDQLMIARDRFEKGLFFSGEDFITYIQHLSEEKTRLEVQIEETKMLYKNKSTFAYHQALSPAKKELYALLHTYDGELTEKSHGEGFLAFFKSRMKSKGIYFLDEPETPLSAINEYQLLVMLTDLAHAGAQIILATHSPILMALKGAVIYEFSDTIKEVSYDNIDTVRFQKDFLNHKDKYLERIQSRGKE